MLPIVLPGQVVETLTLPAALKLVSSCCGQHLALMNHDALQVSLHVHVTVAEPFFRPGLSSVSYHQFATGHREMWAIAGGIEGSCSHGV